ncbi:DNA polymerase III subunit delta [Brevibacillus humidisoli]|uniref:DNA polymerase III subunit delta n=1 Tax=Brevibacillus humidisoli TaxID=2895522 RepID=UPI001E57B201|nr:DNA polymerase III subunit delta [Brevibacillus humidisoli]UFJ38879.1 DNA polymerase III subunit delta [Brevibacillus humidisoli]
MPLHTAVQAIKEKQYASVYVLYGTETYLMDEFVSFASREIVPPDSADLNLSRYDCAEVPLQSILEDAETLPFLAEHRVVIAANAYFLTGAKPPSKLEHNLAALEQYLEQPPAYASILFLVYADKLDERKKLVKSLKKQATVLSFAPLRDGDLLAWVQRRAERHGVRMERVRVQQLVDRVGSDLRLLNNELEKLALYLGTPGAVITDDVIEQLTPRTLEQDVFRLVDAVVAGRLPEAFRTLYDCLLTGEEPLKLLALLARQFRLLLHVKLWAPRGYSQQQLAGMLKVHPFAVKKAMEQTRYFDEASLRRLLGLFAEEDFRIKSGQVDKRLALELLMTRVAAELKPAR